MKENILNSLYPMKKLFGKDDASQNVKCPIHNDSKPSAHIYSNSNSLFCFVCRTQFNVCTIARALGFDLDDLFEELTEIYDDPKAEYYKMLSEKDYKKKTKAPEINKDGKTVAEFTNEFFKIT